MNARLKKISLAILLCSLAIVASAAENFTSTARGAQYRDLNIGEGESAQTGDVATIQFIGWLNSNGTKGKELYNTRKQGGSVSFVIGTDKVMQGWSEGVIGMKKGGKRLLMVPPSLAYGSKGVQGFVPANGSLIFVIELVDLKLKRASQ